MATCSSKCSRKQGTLVAVAEAVVANVVYHVAQYNNTQFRMQLNRFSTHANVSQTKSPHKMQFNTQHNTITLQLIVQNVALNENVAQKLELEHQTDSPHMPPVSLTMSLVAPTHCLTSASTSTCTTYKWPTFGDNNVQPANFQYVPTRGRLPHHNNVRCSQVANIW